MFKITQRSPKPDVNRLLFHVDLIYLCFNATFVLGQPLFHARYSFVLAEQFLGLTPFSVSLFLQFTGHKSFQNIQAIV